QYTIATSSPLLFGPGATTGTIVVNVIDDGVNRPSDAVVLDLGTPSNATLGSPSTNTLTINDGDAPPSVQFALAAASGPESSSPAVLAVTLSQASGFAIRVDYSTSGTAVSGTDYTLPNGTLVVPTGATGAVISAAIINDSPLEELDETLI